MPKLTLQLPDDLYEKLRWLAYREKRTHQAILLEIVERTLSTVEVPKEARG